MVAPKLDLLIKKMGEGSQQQIQAPVYAMGRSSRVKSVAMMDTRGTTAPRPVKMPRTSTTTAGIVHNKEARGGTSRVHHSREVITKTLLSTRISI